MSDFEQVVAARVFSDDFLRFRNLVPGADGILQFRIDGHGVAQFFLRRLFLLHQFGIEHAGEFADVRLAAVLHAEQVFLRAAGVLVAAGAVAGEQHFESVQAFQRVRQALVTHVFQFGDSEKPAGAARMAGNEDQFIFGNAGFAPFQVML